MADSNCKPSGSNAQSRVRKHREALRAQGLRPVTRWVPDTRDPKFQAEYRRQALTLAEHYRNSAEARAEVAYWELLQTHEG